MCANDSENTLKGGQAAAPAVLSFVKSFLTLQSWGEKKDFPVITVFGKLLHEQRAVGVCHPNFCPAFGSHLKPWLEKSQKKHAETQILLSALTKQGAWCWPEVISCVGHWKHCRAITNLAWQNWRTLTSWNLHPTLTAIATRQPNTVPLPRHWKVIFNLKISGRKGSPGHQKGWVFHYLLVLKPPTNVKPHLNTSKNIQRGYVGGKMRLRKRTVIWRQPCFLFLSPVSSSRKEHVSQLYPEWTKLGVSCESAAYTEGKHCFAFSLQYLSGAIRDRPAEGFIYLF